MFDSIAQLLSPHEPEQLEQAIHRHERLYLPTGHPDAFVPLLSWATLNRIITAEELLGGKTTLIRNTRILPVEMSAAFLTHLWQWRRSPEAIHGLIDQGVSIVINFIGRLVPEVAALNSMLERSLGVEVNTNAYVGFRQDSALKTHWDEHDVLILQVSGHKRWRLYGQLHRYPMKHPAFPAAGRSNLELAVDRELVMSPGDILYVPRGDVHKVNVEGDHSVHLTIGLAPRRGHHVVTWLGRDALADEDILRRDVLPFSSPETLAEQEAALRACLHRLVDRLDLHRFILDDHRSRPVAPALNLGVIDTLTSETRVRPAIPRRIPLPPDGGDIELGNRRYQLTAAQSRILTTVLTMETCRVGELETLMGDVDVKAGVDELGRLGLVQLF